VSATINAAAPPPTVNLSSDSGDVWGCSVAGKTGSGGSYIDGTLILAGLGMAVWGIRIRRRRG
jgi:MYXO-CTERM domain-containing protein